MNRWFCLSCASLLALVVAGCGGGGDQGVHLQGKITVNGQDLPADAEGTIMFRTTQAGQGKAATARIAAGAYDSPDTPTGPLKVFITLQKPTGRMLDNGRGDPSPEYASLIAPEYGSGIDLTVDGSKTDQDFDLKGI
jgi:hypothetical protein